MDIGGRSATGFFFSAIAALIIMGAAVDVAYGPQESQPGAALSTMGYQKARSHIELWPPLPRGLAEMTIERYGPPSSSSEYAVVWKKRGPWKRIVIHRDRASPFEHVLTYQVAARMVKPVRALGHGVAVNVWKNELSARSDREDLNFLTLNLAVEIANGRRKPAEAEAFFRKTAALSAAGKSSAYLERLLSAPQPSQVSEWESPE